MGRTSTRSGRSATRSTSTRGTTRSASWCSASTRGAASREEVARQLALYDGAEKEGQRFEDRVRLALQAVLVWPDVLFRVELDPPGVRPGQVYPVGEHELASRLSYFLWSSMPDDE